jgi:hypothetical protein
MKLDFQIWLLRVVIEIVRPLPVIRRYRAVPAPLDGPTGCLLRRRIAGELRCPSSSSGGTSSASP